MPPREILFSQGGVYFSSDAPKDHKKTRFSVYGRAGYVGWMGWGGSAFQWHPRHQIGFAYHTLLHHQVDFYNTRAAKLQEIVRQIVDGSYKPEEKQSGYFGYALLGVTALIVGYVLKTKKMI